MCPQDERDFARVHFIGIGGAGMSGIARVLSQRGYTVTGSDLKASRYTRTLERAGIPVRVGHEAKAIDELNPQVVVISTAIPESNPELARARELGIEVWHRAKMLSYLARGQKTIACAGTHGKTTTSSLVATMLERLNQSPTFLIGGVIDGYETNGSAGTGPFFVAEADESDGSFLLLDPTYVIVTNIEADHLDHYGTLEAVEEAFSKLMASVPDTGLNIVCGDDPRLRELAYASERPVLTYGFQDDNDVVCIPHTESGDNGFTVRFGDGTTVDAHLQNNPGKHNCLNATAALALARTLDLEANEAARALSAFAGVHRRFETVGEHAGVRVVDDYAHHPTEIAATLAAARGLGYRKVHVIFQPHRYTRTQALADAFATAFDDADDIFVMDVFSAGETPIPGISGKTVVTAVQQHNASADITFVPHRHTLLELIAKRVEPGDLVMTMGAGDVTLIGPDLLAYLASQKG